MANDEYLETKPRPKKGIKTTEFWLTLAALAGGVLLILLGHAAEGATLFGLASGSYAISRGLAK